MEIHRWPELESHSFLTSTLKEGERPVWRRTPGDMFYGAFQSLQANVMTVNQTTPTSKPCFTRSCSTPHSLSSCHKTSTMSRPRAGRSRVRFPAWVTLSLFSKTSTPAPGPREPPNQWAQLAFQRGKVTGA
jgi:hypothetical protein